MHPIVEFQWIDIENLTEFRACRNSIQGALLIVDERGTKSCKNTHIGYNTTVHVTIPKDGPYSRYRPRLLVCPLKYHVISLLYHQSYRASDNSRGCRPANFRFFRKIPRISPKNAKSARNISKYMSAKHISYLSWLLDLFYSPQTSKFILKLRHCNE